MLIPLALAIVGLGGGLAAGHMLKPPAPESAAEAPPPPPAPDPAREADAVTGKPPPFDDAAAHEYVALDRQFIVPLVGDRSVGGLMILTLSIEVDAGTSDGVKSQEPKLRDMFLRVLFRHAQSGGFEGDFTTGPAMRDLKGALTEAARSVLGPRVRDVLVTDILRQDH